MRTPTPSRWLTVRLGLQDPRCSKSAVMSALSRLATNEEAMQAVVDRWGGLGVVRRGVGEVGQGAAAQGGWEPAG